MDNIKFIATQVAFGKIEKKAGLELVGEENAFELYNAIKEIVEKPDSFNHQRLSEEIVRNFIKSE